MPAGRAPIERGEWSETLSWELHQSSVAPDHELCTAVFCLAIVEDNKVILMRAARGWGMLGGHIEPGESPLDALRRESLEEGGFTPHDPQLYSYRRIESKRPYLHQDGKSYYPFPISYVLYYWATTLCPVAQYSGAEVLESKAFSIEEIPVLGINDTSTIELGWRSYLAAGGGVEGERRQ